MVGPFPDTQVFREKTVEATMSLPQLAQSSKWARRALLGSMRGSEDPNMDKAIYEKTLEEVSAGRARGPFTEEELIVKLGTDFLPARRFGIEQNGSYRQIDDFSEFGHNETASRVETVYVGGVDLFALARRWTHHINKSAKGLEVQLLSLCYRPQLQELISNSVTSLRI